ncbi:MAG: ArsR family transcriptional regulator [Candidatus Odinarchaeia archaeon]
MSLDEKIFHELQAIKKILILNNKDEIDEYLSDIIKTDVRKIIWKNIDGIRQQKELVEISGIAQPSVSVFLNILKDAGLIEYETGKPPRKIIDYVPSDWLE